MISSITLENFKCFKETTTFPFSKINLLTGINGRGKSTVLQSMLLFKQSVEEDKYTNLFNLRGDVLNIGTYQDLSNSKNLKKDLENVITFNFNNNIILAYKLGENRNDKHSVGVSLLVFYLDSEKQKRVAHLWNNDSYDLHFSPNFNSNQKIFFDETNRIGTGEYLIYLLPQKTKNEILSHLSIMYEKLEVLKTSEKF